MGFLRKSLGMVVSRAFGLTSADFVAGLGGFGSTYGGRTITPFAALQTSTVWACVRLISETAAMLQMEMYTKSTNGVSEPVPDHPLNNVLNVSPNADMSPIEFWTCMFASLELWGNGCSQVVRASNGRVISLTPMRPDRVRQRRNPDGSIQYQYSNGVTQLTLDQKDVFHIKGFSLDGYWGLSTIAAARNSIGNAQSMEEQTGTSARNGLRASGFLTKETFFKSDDRERLRIRLQEFEGTGNAGKTMILEGGLKYQQLTMPAADAQLLEQGKFTVEEICRFYQVPPWMVGHTDKTTSWGTGVEQQGQAFLTYTLQKRLEHAEQAISKTLLTPADRARYQAKANIDMLLRTDSAARAAYLATMGQNGYLTRNEGRKKENLPPAPGGDVLTVGSNLVPLDQLGKILATPTPDGFGVPKPPKEPTTQPAST